ncbi:tetratricopeptide repeat protein [Leptospira yasudae]|uniref:tetratricopeptide repeat protein n=1 Tax=Leptospira yasudae TaxID=2202201 RepID=UPI001091129B|nr:tetratricopeptide repeat protein [Leptospira yasudae]MBW0432056.1 tetratricopeptide repeat protein [Leptospira yasudae]TGN02414.1 tetratricopeptide repeat protein [Leptospira yasudae]
MANRILGWFLILGIIILLLSIVLPGSKDTNPNDPAAVAQPSWIETALSGILAAIREIKTSMASSSSSDSSDTNAGSPSGAATGEDPNEVFNRAYQANERGEYKKAVEEYSKYLELVPGDASGYYNRGLALYTMKQYEDAVKDFDKAVEIDPNKTAAYLYKGYGNEMIDDCMQAIEDFQKAIDLGENKNSELYGHKARCENKDEDYTAGLESARKAVNLDKKNAYALFELGYAQYALGKYAESVASYSKTLSFNPNDEVAYHNRGLAYVFLKKTPLACKDFRKSLDLGYQDSGKRLKEYCK